ncbi:MAG TPA: GH116 family glycosyl hydrolase, partial [Candidatus Hydrogenedentes bacterium]|nr:GH116 family glycosyl hydrolase [Candidatus Hydrogenedentota bacterium]
RSLYERGTKEVFRGKSLENIGMPCGGIGAGQLYLCGDGTLGCWQIFNNAASNWVEGTHATYKHRGIAKPVDQGFAVSVLQGSDLLWRPLNSEGFADIEFQGEYPIGTVRYASPGFPVKIEMEAFSPFVPLNATDSTLPATVFHITVENVTDDLARVSIGAWLQNAVGHAYGLEHDALRRTRLLRERGRAFIVHSAEERPVEPPAEAAAPRAPIAFADFESDGYGDWRVEGDAFGPGPAKGTLPGQNPVTGFLGDRLVNTFFGGDDAKGALTSPAFTVSRRYVNFLIGGGNHPERTCMNLVVEGRAVRSATGRNNEALQWHAWDVAEFEGKQAHLVIVDDKLGGWGHINIDHIEFADALREGSPATLETAADYGTLALACVDGVVAVTRRYPGRPAEQYVVENDAVYGIRETRLGYLRSAEIDLARRQRCTFTFVLAWHFPNQQNGHHYAARFEDAAAVARYVLDHHDRLSADTRRWRDTYYDSTLPYWLLDRLHSVVSNLATGTCQYWKNGRFWAYEGVTCCHGTCTHVWNYAHAHARLFPELARSARELQDFNPRENGGGFHPETGLVGFRSDDNYAADGQCGTILKAFREHLTSRDNAFLERNWPSIRKALEYSIEQDAKGVTGGAPEDPDGLIENTQHNTYDINYEGANTFVGGLYLAALRAGEEMAKIVGDAAFAERARALFESGRDKTVDRLWNGEYFVQEVDLEKYPKHQYKDGCLSDQLFGQGWAHHVGLGYIYPPELVQTALRSIWKYNWAPDIGPYNEVYPPFRWFVSPGEAGLLTCTWPKSDHLKEGTLYREEVWTGIEYQVAGHMIWEGMIEEGLAVCRAAHDRYHPDRFNPYNEIECGDHYARALASWGVYHALAGFEYDGPRGFIAFAPRFKPDHFKAAFTAAEGWGVFEQRIERGAHTTAISMRWGGLRLKTCKLATAADFKVRHVRAAFDGATVDAAVDCEPGGVTVRLAQELALGADTRFEVILES